MSFIESSFDGQTLTITLPKRIDTTNSAEVGDELIATCEAHLDVTVELDGSKLEYISSAGLRVILRLNKAMSKLSITNLARPVYEVFDVTGFTAFMDVRKEYRRLSVEGCPIIGQGAKGVLYRISDEAVCKVFRDPDSLGDINREKDLATAAFVAGLPTAISYEVVRVGDGYGSVFELLNAKTIASLLASGEWDVERAAQESAELLAQMAETELPTVELPSAREKVLGWVHRLKTVLDEATYARLCELAEAIPDDPYVVHGDFHMNNVMVQDDEPLLIDMDTLSRGNAIIDLGITYSTHVGRGMLDRRKSEEFLGFDWDDSRRLWKLLLRYRFPNANEEQLREIEDKARVIGAARLMGRPLHHDDIDEELAQRTYGLYGEIIRESLARIDSLAL